jgi:hypothetical protein
MYVLYSQLYTVGYQHGTMGIVGATTGLFVQITTANLGVEHLTTVFIFELVQATLGTAITQGLPLGIVELAQ